MALSDAAVERIAREFRPRDQVWAENLLDEYLAVSPAGAEHVWPLVLDLAGGDLESLRHLVSSNIGDPRERRMGADAWNLLARLVATGGRGPIPELAPHVVDEARRTLAHRREQAARYFPVDRVDEVVLRMVGWPNSVDGIFALARGDAGRLRGILEGRTAGAIDPATPPALAQLPCAAAELIRRDFALEDWDAAARAAAHVPEMRGVGGALEWLLVAEYAGGNVDDLRAAVRLQKDDQLVRAVARRREARRNAAAQP